MIGARFTHDDPSQDTVRLKRLSPCGSSLSRALKGYAVPYSRYVRSTVGRYSTKILTHFELNVDKRMSIAFLSKQCFLSMGLAITFHNSATF